ncbi:sulfurtransferase FdhD [Rhodoferax lacus]|uniref:Sulfur carrier protein FdhD n=1 Tax=Rhodoferax lacus TaxID=2184758 RepID=A0A3E1RGD2_9BURK|nr:formate dehydrogenase accessory sulfurtransferase FdhD [Rhodoferax lacus]RFO98082.1 sulfurtransferase FdhD [Rhodoferax lacus]
MTTLATHAPLYLTQASAALTHSVDVVNEFGETYQLAIPSERALTVYVDKRELITVMTLGAHPEWLVLGYLLNQRLVSSFDDIESVTVDWEVGAAAVKTRSGIADLEQKTARRVVTTGCGQGSVFGDMMDGLDALQLPDTRITQAQLYSVVNAIRLQQSVYKTAGSVHGCALFAGEEMLLFVEDVGRHNAIDTIAGWMALNGVQPEGKVFYTTGRLTSEMVVKAAQMGIAVVVSRSGMTQMGHSVAQRLGLCAIGRATNKRFVCFSGAGRLQLQPELAGLPVRAAA